MTGRMRTASWIRLAVTLGLVVAAGSARSQDVETSTNRDKVNDQSSVTSAGHRERQRSADDDVTPATQKANRWQRFKNGIWPFRPKGEHVNANDASGSKASGFGQGSAEAKVPPADDGSQNTKSKAKATPAPEERRVRWLLGRDVKFAPGEDTEDDHFGPWAPQEDSAVSPAEFSAPQDKTPLPDLPPIPPGSIPGAQDIRDGFVNGQIPRDSPTSFDPQQPTTPDRADQPLTPEAIDAATQNLATEDSAQSQREPYGFCKRFLRGYPRLVLWFPNYLGPPRKGGPSLYGGELDDTETYRAGERSGGGGYEPPDAPRRAPPSPWDSPPFPTSEYQGYPLIGVPMNPTEDPIQKALLLGPYGDAIRG